MKQSQGDEPHLSWGEVTFPRSNIASEECCGCETSNPFFGIGPIFGGGGELLLLVQGELNKWS